MRKSETTPSRSLHTNIFTIFRWCVLLLLLGLGAVLLFHMNSAARAQTPTPQPDKKLRVLIGIVEPFVIKQGDIYAGFSVDLWAALAQRMGLAYEWVEVTTPDEMLKMIQEGDVDLAVSKIIMTPDREKIMDFSAPYLSTGLQIMVGEEQRSFLGNLLSTLFRPELLQVLGIGLVTLLIMAHIIWLMERGKNEAIPKAYLPGIWEAMWYALSTVATLEYADKEKPKDPLRRIVAMVMVVMGIVLIAQFTAAITASLTVQQLSGTINGPGDLSGKTVGTLAQSASADYLSKHGILYVGADTMDQVYGLLEQGEVQAVVFDAPVLQYYAANQGKGKVKVVGPVFNTSFYAIALPQGSALRKPVNEALLGLMQDGTYQQIYEKWFGSQ
jgi:polar amino acid transport system substrate-binding protein